MGSQARKIPEREWERHSDTILHLYHDLHLPLHSDKDEGSVQKTMRDVHQFDASISQFEAFFRRRGRPKNLKRDEWRAVHAKLSELIDMEFETRVRISGQVLSKERLERSKRYALSQTRHPYSSLPSLELPSSNRVAIEYRIPGGEWIVYSDRNVGADSHNSSSTTSDQSNRSAEYTSPLQSLGRRLSPQTKNPTRPLQARRPSREVLAAFMHPSSPSRELVSRRQSPKPMTRGRQSSFPSSPWNSPLQLFDFDPLSEMGDIRFQENDQSQGLLFDALLSQPCWAAFTPGQLWDETSAPLGSPAQVYNTCEISANHSMLAHEMEATLWHAAASSIQPFVQSLIQETAQMSAYDSSISLHTKGMELPRINEVLDDLLSTTPESLVRGGSEQWSQLSRTDHASDSILFNAVLSSIANGFAGLDKVPIGAVFRVLRKQTHMSPRLFECLKSSQLPVARALADNLFRASVEACDEQAVKAILQQTQNSSIAIDPNSIACRFPGAEGLYTPIEVAARFRHFGIVQTLLAAHADVDKTYGGEYDECGALEQAVRRWGDQKPVELGLLRILLDHRPTVKPHLVLAAARWGQTDIVRELILRLQPPSHRMWFDDEAPPRPQLLPGAKFDQGINRTPEPPCSRIEEAVQHVENKVALLLVGKVLEHCQAEHCLECIQEKQKQIIPETLLWTATKTGNLELAKLLMPHITNKTMALSAVVKTGDRALIDFAFELGAVVSGQPCGLLKYHTGLVRMSTQYAENGHLDAFNPPNVTLFINPLSEAVRLQNKDLIHEFESLETPTATGWTQQNHWGAALAAAAQVGDLGNLESLLQRMPSWRPDIMGNALSAAIFEDEMDAAWMLVDHDAALSSEPLVELVQKQHEPLVDRFLETRHRIHFQLRLLRAAMEWGNIPLIEYLMSNMASAERFWFDEALRSNNNEIIRLAFREFGFSRNPPNSILENEWAFNMFIQDYATIYPRGIRGVGGNLLATAIEKQSATLIKTLLAMNVDVNSEVKKLPSKLYIDMNIDIGGNLPSDDYITPFGFGIQFQRGTHVDLVQQLIDAGGNLQGLVLSAGKYDELDYVTVKRTALLMAIETSSEQMVELLLKNGADPHQQARRGLRRTPLQQACEAGNVNIVNMLLERVLDVNEPPALDAGATSLQLASMSGNIRIAKLLLARGADVHAPKARVEGKTALEGAAANGRMHMIELLRGAVNGQGFSRKEIDNAIRLAKDHGHHGCAQYIATVFGIAASSSSLIGENSFVGSELVALH